VVKVDFSPRYTETFSLSRIPAEKKEMFFFHLPSGKNLTINKKRVSWINECVKPTLSLLPSSIHLSGNYPTNKQTNK
jgi:hypothetical protein